VYIIFSHTIDNFRK